MKTGVLVHGCNLNIENWRHVAWGDPPDLPGRIPQGILIAWQLQAELVVFGTGASSKEFRLGNSTGNVAVEKGPRLLEAEYSLEYLRRHFDNLFQFHALQDMARQSPEVCQAIVDSIVLDTQSQNTAEEIQAAAELFVNRGIQRMVLVSSPSHIVRCLRDAASICDQHPHLHGLRHQILAAPSVTCYEGTDAADVVVVEPPHRPDRHVVPTHRRIQRMLTLQKLEHDELVSLIEEFDDLLQRYEHVYFNRQHQNS